MITALNSDHSNEKAYDLWSKQYDLEINSTIAVDDTHFPPLWSHLTQKRILEIGCGTGRHTLRLVRQENDVTGIDVSSGMLKVARTKPALKGVHLIHGDFLHYNGFMKGSFDAAIASLVVEHVSELDRFFERAFDILKAGGELFLSEIHPDRTHQGSQAHFVKRETGEEVRTISYPHKSDEITGSAIKAGFRLVCERDVLGSRELAAINKDWQKYLDKPMIKIWVFGKHNK